jgi:hypothetical protein
MSNVSSVTILEVSLKRAIAALIATVALSVDATAFDNIEADAYYDGPLKQQMTNEYSTMLLRLDDQAKMLGVERRKKDIDIAKNHFATKAVMMARCLDTGISKKKMMVGDMDLAKYTSDCVKTHLSFMAWIQAGGKVDDTCLLDNESLALQRQYEKPLYDFLYVDSMVPGYYDVIALRECHLAKRAARERERMR